MVIDDSNQVGGAVRDTQMKRKHVVGCSSACQVKCQGHMTKLKIDFNKNFRRLGCWWIVNMPVNVPATEPLVCWQTPWQRMWLSKLRPSPSCTTHSLPTHTHRLYAWGLPFPWQLLLHAALCNILLVCVCEPLCGCAAEWELLSLWMSCLLHSVLIPRVWNGKPLRLGQLACYIV